MDVLSVETAGQLAPLTEGATAVLLSVIGVAAGIIQCYFGYRAFKWVLRVCAFILAASVTVTAVPLIVQRFSESSGQGTGNAVYAIALLLGAALGVFMAKIAAKYYRFAVFIGVFTPCALLSSIILMIYNVYLEIRKLSGDITPETYDNLRGNFWQIFLFMLLISFVIGVIAAKLTRFTIILQSSITGAGMLSGSITALTGFGVAAVMTTVAVALAITGFVYQWRTSKDYLLNVGAVNKGKKTPDSPSPIENQRERAPSPPARDDDADSDKEQ